MIFQASKGDNLLTYKTFFPTCNNSFFTVRKVMSRHLIQKMTSHITQSFLDRMMNEVSFEF